MALTPLATRLAGQRGAGVSAQGFRITDTVSCEP